MRKDYEMTQVQFQRLMDACKPVTYLVVGGIEPTSPAENANRAWEVLAEELGFIWDTVEPISGKEAWHFSAQVAPLPPPVLPTPLEGLRELVHQIEIGNLQDDHEHDFKNNIAFISAKSILGALI